MCIVSCSNTSPFLMGIHKMYISKLATFTSYYFFLKILCLQLSNFSQCALQNGSLTCKFQFFDIFILLYLDTFCKWLQGQFFCSKSCIHILIINKAVIELIHIELCGEFFFFLLCVIWP